MKIECSRCKKLKEEKEITSINNQFICLSCHNVSGMSEEEKKILLSKNADKYFDENS